MSGVCVIISVLELEGGKYRQEKKKKYPRSASQLTVSLTVVADLQIFSTLTSGF